MVSLEVFAIIYLVQVLLTAHLLHILTAVPFENEYYKLLLCIATLCVLILEIKGIEKLFQKYLIKKIITN